jgi:hypothetical protein
MWCMGCSLVLRGGEGVHGFREGRSWLLDLQEAFCGESARSGDETKSLVASGSNSARVAYLYIRPCGSIWFDSARLHKTVDGACREHCMQRVSSKLFMLLQRRTRKGS